jgi:hypothetical protein
MITADGGGVKLGIDHILATIVKLTPGKPVASGGPASCSYDRETHSGQAGGIWGTDFL